jgi:hypothetical protein
MLLLVYPGIRSFVKPLPNATTGLTKARECNANLFSKLYLISRLKMRPIHASERKILTRGSGENRVSFLL